MSSGKSRPSCLGLNVLSASQGDGYEVISVPETPYLDLGAIRQRNLVLLPGMDGDGVVDALEGQFDLIRCLGDVNGGFALQQTLFTLLVAGSWGDEDSNKSLGL